MALVGTGEIVISSTQSANKLDGQALSRIFTTVLMGSVVDEDLEYAESMVELLILDPQLVHTAYQRRGEV